MYYGGWGHCNVVRLKEDFTGIRPFDDGELYKEITPERYTEGPFLFERKGKYYFMWSEGAWTAPTIRWPTPCRIRRSDRSNASERSCGRTPPWLREPDITP